MSRLGLLCLLEKLTSDERIDKAVDAYCRHIVSLWEKAWTGQSPIGKQLRLMHYVPARFSIELTREEWIERSTKAVEKDESHNGKRVDRFEPVGGESEEEVLDNLIKWGDGCLCLSEGPGTGKSIFSRRMQAYLCTREAQLKYFKDRPALIIRWEESPERKGVPFPLDFQKGFAEEIAPYLEKREDAMDLVTQLLRENRVLLILDALDQVTEPSEAALNKFLYELSKDRPDVSARQCQFIFTSRPYADTLARRRVDRHCRMARIERFDLKQQYAYLFGPVPQLAPLGGAWLDRDIPSAELSLVPAAEFHEGLQSFEVENAIRKSIRSLLPDADDDDPIVSSPQALFLVREFCEEQKAKNRSTQVRFQSLGDLYSQVCRNSLERAYQNSIQDKQEVDPEILDWLEAMLSAMAMQMLVTDPARFSFGRESRDELSSLRSKAQGRVAVDRPVMPAKFNSATAWKVVTEVSQLTNRLTGVVSDEKSLSWPDQRMKEYYAARHLVKNFDPNWVVHSQTDAIACGDPNVPKSCTHSTWWNVWSLALDLAELGKIDERCFAAAARHLFDEIPQSQPNPKEKLGHWLRPTFSMYRAWKLFQETGSNFLQKEGRRIVASFQSQFIAIIELGDRSKARIAAQLVPDHILRRLVPDRFDELKESQLHYPSFVKCPPTDAEGFWMGARASNSPAEYPHRVQLDSFLMTATPVTREQYALFSPNFLAWSDDQYKFHNSSPRCPMVGVNWCSAFMFALFTGNRLPSEAQWEYACRAGSTGEYCLYEVDGKLQQATATSLCNVAYFDQAFEPGPQEVGLLRPNAWGLFDMHGKVWEFVEDWYDEGYYQRPEAVRRNPTGPIVGSYRVRRGGSFIEPRWNCRNAIRGTIGPLHPFPDVGFRLSRQLNTPTQ